MKEHTVMKQKLMELFPWFSGNRNSDPDTDVILKQDQFSATGHGSVCTNLSPHWFQHGGSNSDKTMSLTFNIYTADSIDYCMMSVCKEDN